MTGILGGARWFLGLSILPSPGENCDTWVLKSDHDKIVRNLDNLKEVQNLRYTQGQQYIVCAAARNSETGKIVCSPRHYDYICHQSIPDEEKYESWKYADQGFVDQFGKFLTRAEAWKIAVAAGQIRRRCGGDGEELYSENLY